jgi:hypothetical protein
VGVNASVGVNVWVGVDVGVGEKMIGSGVNVRVGSCKFGCRVCDKAVWTNPAITVSAAAVLIAFASGSVRAGTAQARITIDKMMTGTKFR